MTLAGRVLIALGLAMRQTWRTPHRAALAARLACWLIVVSLLARVVSLPRIQRLLSFRFSSSRTLAKAAASAAHSSPERLAGAIDAILRLELPILRGGRCWKRALVLQRFVVRQGIDCRVTFGVRRADAGPLEGHAWLERDGHPWLERDAATDTYTVTFRLPAEATCTGDARVVTDNGGALGAMEPIEVMRGARAETIAAPGTGPSLDLRPGDDAELHVLLECARGVLDGDRAAALTASIAAGGIDWDRLMRLAKRHSLGPLVAWHLPRICPALMPPAVLAMLRGYERTHHAFSLLLTGELLRLITALEAEGIEAMPFKGPALSAHLYGHVARRQYGDLDILVRPHDVWRASAVLAALGFTADTDVPIARRDACLRDDYVRMFRRDQGRLLVELHWGIARRAFATRFDADRIWPRLTPLSLQGATVASPSDEDLLLMLCVHGGRHGWEQLEGLAGINALLERADRGASFDWEYVWRHARLMRCQRNVAFALMLVAGLFERPLPPGAARHLQSTGLLCLAREIAHDFQRDALEARSGASLALVHLQLKDGVTDRARYCAGTFFTSTPEDWAAVPLRGPLAWSYPFVRAVRVARRYGFAR
jgi:hypothetical protein